MRRAGASKRVTLFLPGPWGPGQRDTGEHLQGVQQVSVGPLLEQQRI